MPLKGIDQPLIIEIDEDLRLKKYDGNPQTALEGYRDPYVYQNSEGIFDESKIPNLDYVTGMFKYLDNVGELYFIEVKEVDGFIPVGDVTIKQENPPIAIWFERYRGKGIGKKVMQTVIARMKELGFKKITGSTVYKWNTHSLNLHKGLGFVIVEESKDEYKLELTL